MNENGNGVDETTDALELRVGRIERRQDHQEAVTLADVRGLETLVRQVQLDVATAHQEAMRAIVELHKSFNKERKKAQRRKKP